MDAKELEKAAAFSAGEVLEVKFEEIAKKMQDERFKIKNGGKRSKPKTRNPRGQPWGPIHQI